MQRGAGAGVSGGQPPHLGGVAVTEGPQGGHRTGAEDPTDQQTTLEILQQQLESFQTFWQQTLENINTVQSKIRQILNENTFERKTLLCSSDNSLMTCTPRDASPVKLNQKFSEIQVAPEYDSKTEASQTSLKNYEDLQKTVHDLPHENLAHKNEVEHLTVTIQSLKEKISKCNAQIKGLTEEKKSVQIQLVKSQEDNKECIKEIENVLRKCKELQSQKNILEEERNQLHDGNQHSVETQHDFHIRNQKVEEMMTAATCERVRASDILELLEKQRFKLQETNKKFKIEISQITKVNNFLEQVFGKKSE